MKLKWVLVPTEKVPARENMVLITSHVGYGISYYFHPQTGRHFQRRYGTRKYSEPKGKWERWSKGEITL